MNFILNLESHSVGKSIEDSSNETGQSSGNLSARKARLIVIFGDRRR